MGFMRYTSGVDRHIDRQADRNKSHHQRDQVIKHAADNDSQQKILKVK